MSWRLWVVNCCRCCRAASLADQQVQTFPILSPCVCVFNGCALLLRWCDGVSVRCVVVCVVCCIILGMVPVLARTYISHGRKTKQREKKKKEGKSDGEAERMLLCYLRLVVLVLQKASFTWSLHTMCSFPWHNFQTHLAPHIQHHCFIEKKNLVQVKGKICCTKRMLAKKETLLESFCGNTCKSLYSLSWNSGSKTICGSLTKYHLNSILYFRSS